MRSAIIVDCFNVGWSAGFAMKGLTHENEPTNVLYGFFKTILQAANYIEKPATVLFAWDSRKSRRELIFPDYKKKRKERLMSNEDIAMMASVHTQLDKLKEDILPSIGFTNHFHKTGYEADDIIASLVKYKNFDTYLVISTDNDLYQILKPSVSIYSPKLSKVVTHESFTNEYNINPSDWAMVKALAGCASDNVPGIDGIGEKSAIDYINNNLSRKAVAKIERAMLTPEFERDKKLVTLPLDQLDFDIKYDVLTRRKLINVFVKYNFISLMRKEAISKWTLLLDLI